MAAGRVIISQVQFQLMIERLCLQLLEHHDRFEQTCIIGVQQRGVLLADRIVEQLSLIDSSLSVPYGKLDIAFYRDDFRRRSEPISPSANEIDFIVEDQSVILIDDVLYSGRTTQAALRALQDFGRPSKVEFLCLVDRQFNRVLPIQADYAGMRVDSIDEAYVQVRWQHIHGADEVLIFDTKAKPDSPYE